MVEEIKKEIEINTVIVDDYYDNETEVICKEVLFKILDKYKNQKEYLIVDKKMFKKRLNNQLCNDYEPDCEDYWLAGLEDRANELEKYKNAWEDLYNKNLMLKTPNMKLLQLEMKELEQKHGIKEEEK